jgi:hypothetical protein
MFRVTAWAVRRLGTRLIRSRVECTHRDPEAFGVSTTSPGGRPIFTFSHGSPHVRLVRVGAEDEHRLEQLDEHLELAVAHRTTVGMALGIPMERYSIDHEAAFARLRRASSVHNRKLYDIARELIDKRVLPDDPPTAHPADRPPRA